MSEKIDRKLKTALDETRLLILGVQILLGFEFQCAFQDRFDRLSEGAKQLNRAALGLIVLSIAVLIAPSMQHRIVEAGQSTARLILTTNRLASTALMPLTAGLALSAYVVVQLTFGAPAGLAVAAFLGSAAAFCWFGLEIFVVSRHQEPREMQHSPTPLKTKIEQLLTEARLIIPGGQALLGFQFIAMLTSGFDRLPETAKVVHAAALCLIGMNVIVMMTPAALHRMSLGGEDSSRFLRMGSALVTVGPAFLAAGISAEIYVVFFEGAVQLAYGYNSFDRRRDRAGRTLVRVASSAPKFLQGDCMKIIFLDIDGVLNCDKTPNPRKFPYVVDKKLLARLHGLLERTKARVVLSSSWRCDPVGLLAAKHWGVPFIDVCPDKPKSPRGKEMQQWLADHPRVTRFAVIDDEDDELDDLPLFQPSSETGLTPEIAKGVERYLSGKTDETMRLNAMARLGQNIHSLFKRSKS